MLSRNGSNSLVDASQQSEVALMSPAQKTEKSCPVVKIIIFFWYYLHMIYVNHNLKY